MNVIFAPCETPRERVFWVNVFPGPHYGHRSPAPFKSKSVTPPIYRIKVTMKEGGKW